MNKHFMIGVLVALAAITAALVIMNLLPAPGEIPAAGEVLNCGYDEDCFYTALDSCSPARMIDGGRAVLSSQNATIILRSEIKGVIDGSCTVYYSVDRMETTNRSAMPDDVLEAFDEMEGAYMTCSISSVTGDADCSGPLHRMIMDNKPQESASVIDSFCEGDVGYAVLMNDGFSDIRLGSCQVSGNMSVCGDVTVRKNGGSEEFDPSFSDERIGPGEIAVFEDSYCGQFGCIYEFSVAGRTGGVAVIYC